MNSHKWFPEGSDGYKQQQELKARRKEEQAVQAGLSQGELPGFTEIVARYRLPTITQLTLHMLCD